MVKPLAEQLDHSNQITGNVTLHETTPSQRGRMAASMLMVLLASVATQLQGSDIPAMRGHLIGHPRVRLPLAVYAQFPGDAALDNSERPSRGRMEYGLQAGVRHSSLRLDQPAR
jgi:hypothetical protein